MGVIPNVPVITVISVNNGLSPRSLNPHDRTDND